MTQRSHCYYLSVGWLSLLTTRLFIVISSSFDKAITSESSFYYSYYDSVDQPTTLRQQDQNDVNAKLNSKETTNTITFSTFPFSLSQECQERYNTTKFQSFCIENHNFFNPQDLLDPNNNTRKSSYCQKLSNGRAKSRLPPSSISLTGNKHNNTTTPSLGCKTLWLSGMSIGFQKETKVDDGYLIQYITAFRSYQKHARHLLQPVLVLLTSKSPLTNTTGSSTSNNNNNNLSLSQQEEYLLSWLRRHGVIILYVNELSFQDLVYEAYPEYANNGKIAFYLRLDFPKIVREQSIGLKQQMDRLSDNICDPDVIFYTDSDILFTNYIPESEFSYLKRQLTADKFLMYGQDFLIHRPKPGNTGVMFIHLDGFDQVWETKIKAWGVQQLDKHKELMALKKEQQQKKKSNDNAANLPDWYFPPHDQLWLNRYYADPKKWRKENLLLPTTWNWKVYWQLEEEMATTEKIRIVHFHGPKPKNGIDEASLCQIESIQPDSGYFPHDYHVLIASAMCCDYGKTAYRILQLYDYWKPKSTK